MIMLSDDELREELGKYMESVPPVTGSTREVLRAKLAKFQSSKSEDAASKRSRTVVATTETTEVLEPVSPPELEKSPSPQKSTVGGAGGDKPLPPQSPVSPNSFVYEDSSFRVRRFPQTDLPDYPGGIPVFRRRSLHPSGKDDSLPDPYEEFYIRSPRLQAKIDAQRIMSKVMSSTEKMRHRHTSYAYSRASSKRASWFRKPDLRGYFDLLTRALSGLFSLLLVPFTALRVGTSRICASIGCRNLLLLFLLFLFVGVGLFLLFSDPFYRNPVAEFAERISEPLASLLQKSDD
ncbi:unnamed protein product [Mesocestoides corti]|uniref:LEM domain-containing protein n=1 Tax=Mesocestoides corti TaxID=53468 RepID=A0A0R3UKD4_MESCO|nr:unnamed protein product [Mesocestoides corti]